MKFQPGQSGNPTGRPKGARHKTTLAIESLLDGEAEALTRKVIEKAKEGDLAALKLCLDRLLPMRKGTRPVFRATATGGHFGNDEFSWEQPLEAA